MRGASPPVLLACAGIAEADQVVERGNNYPGATVRGLRDGRLVYRRATGKEHSPWLTSVERLDFDRGGPFMDLSEAEGFRVNGEVERALSGYRRARRLASDFWIELIDVRVAMTLQESGRIGDFAKAFILVVGGRETGPAVAARLFPENLPGSLTKELNQAVLDLTSAASAERQPPRAFMYRLMAYYLLSHVKDERAAAMASTVCSFVPAASVRTEAVYGAIADALRRWLLQEDSAAGRHALNQAIADCPDALLPSLLMLKGDVLVSAARASSGGGSLTPEVRKSMQEAALSYMRIPIHMPGSKLCGRALFQAAEIMEQLDRKTKAVALLEEAESSNRLEPSLRSAIKTSLDRLRADLGQGGDASSGFDP